jgi:hypothetical protein
MSEEDAAHYKDAVKIESTLEIRTPTGSTGDFLKSQPKSEPGTSTKSPWELFRFVALRQAPHKQAAVMLAAWCASSGLTPRLEVRTVAIGDFQRRVIYLLLSSDR